MIAGLTDEEYLALAKRRKLTPTMVAHKIVKDAEAASIIIPCPCNCGILVRKPGIDPKTGRAYTTHLVRRSALDAKILRCDCALAVQFGKVCSHVIAIQLLHEQAVVAASEAAEKDDTACR